MNGTYREEKKIDPKRIVIVLLRRRIQISIIDTRFIAQKMLSCVMLRITNGT